MCSNEVYLPRKTLFSVLLHNAFCSWGKPVEFYEAIWITCKTNGAKPLGFLTIQSQAEYLFIYLFLHWQLSSFYIKMKPKFHQKWNKIKHQTHMTYTLLIWRVSAPWHFFQSISKYTFSVLFWRILRHFTRHIFIKSLKNEDEHFSVLTVISKMMLFQVFSVIMVPK